MSRNFEGIKIINLRGGWHQMGRQYGRMAKEQMWDVLQYLDRKLDSEAGRVAAAYEIADRLYEKYPDYLKEFFEGAVRTSELSLERLKLCNAAEYVEGCFFCSAMAAWGDYSEGKLVFGRNYDALSYAEIAKDLIVTVFHPDDAPAAAIVGYAGEIYCVNGLNENGVFIELNNGMPSAGEELHWDLCPSTTELFKLLFQARSIADADAFFERTRSFGSFIIGVADKSAAHAYEWCYEGMKVADTMGRKTVMMSTNHYVHKDWAYEVPGDENSWDSISRRCNLEQLSERNKGQIDVERMKEIMSTPLKEGGPRHDLTRYQIVAVPEDLTLHIHNPHIGKWVELDMHKYFCKSDN